MRQLVVLAGPIGAGKSTLASILGHRFAAAGLTAVGADLDDVAFTHRGRVDLPDFWRRAGIAHLGLVRGWFAAGVDVVIAHGPFFESGSYDDLLATAEPDGRAHHVLLEVSVDDALERVARDTDRPRNAVSKDPAFLRATHDAFHVVAATLPRIDLRLDTSAMQPDDIADRVASLVL